MCLEQGWWVLRAVMWPSGPPDHCSLLQGPMTISSVEEGTAGKIRLPREIFQSLSSQAARVVVTVLDIQQLGMFKV